MKKVFQVCIWVSSIYKVFLWFYVLLDCFLISIFFGLYVCEGLVFRFIEFRLRAYLLLDVDHLGSVSA